MPFRTKKQPNFRQLFQLHHVFVWRALRRFGVPQHGLEDAVQDVFVVMYRRWRDFDQTQDVRGWLWGIARKVAQDVRRGASRRDRLAVELESLAQDRALAPEVTVLYREQIEWLDAVLASLPPEQFDVFLLCEIEEMTGPEAGRVLDVPTNTIYSRLHAARQTIQSAFVRWRGEEDKRGTAH